jgi:hypothetical protein
VEGWRTAGTFVVFRPTGPTPWVEEELETRRREREQADAELEQSIVDPDPGVQGQSIYELEDAQAIVARVLEAFGRLEEMEQTLPGQLEAAKREAQASRLLAEGAQRQAEQARAELRDTIDELRPGRTAEAERTEVSRASAGSSWRATRPTSGSTPCAASSPRGRS